MPVCLGGWLRYSLRTLRVLSEGRRRRRQRGIPGPQAIGAGSKARARPSVTHIRHKVCPSDRAFSTAQLSFQRTSGRASRIPTTTIDLDTGLQYGKGYWVGKQNTTDLQRRKRERGPLGTSHSSLAAPTTTSRTRGAHVRPGLSGTSASARPTL